MHFAAHETVNAAHMLTDPVFTRQHESDWRTQLLLRSSTACLAQNPDRHSVVAMPDYDETV